MNMKRMIAGVFLGMAVSAGAWAAEAFPNKPISLVLGFPPGGGATGMLRLIAAEMQNDLGVPVVVEFRAGANGSIAAGRLAKAAPDGYSLMMMASTHIVNGFSYKDLGYETLSDFSPVAGMYSSAFILTANINFPVNNVKELITNAKANPNKITYGSAGIGSMNHLFQVALDEQVGMHMMHVPYQGGGPSLTDLLGGQINLLMQSMPQGLPLVLDKRVKALAVTSLKRSPALPNVPTLSESGAPGYSGEIWYGILGPKGIPPAIKRRLEQSAQKALQTPKVKAFLDETASVALAGTGDEMNKMMIDEIQKWKPLFDKGLIK